MEAQEQRSHLVDIGPWVWFPALSHFLSSTSTAEPIEIALSMIKYSISGTLQSCCVCMCVFLCVWALHLSYLSAPPSMQPLVITKTATKRDTCWNFCLIGFLMSWGKAHALCIGKKLKSVSVSAWVGQQITVKLWTSASALSAVFSSVKIKILKGWSHSTMGKALALHSMDPNLILGTP